MSAEPVLLERLLTGCAIALVIAGAAAALLSPSAIKRLAALTIAGLGALAALALWAPQAVTAGVAIMFAQLAVGVALVVRLQESYGAIEAPELDAADAESEPQDRGQ
ncbi:MAG: hypothetical protein ACT4OF_10745 [Caulobacteraceae bacterium]